MGKYPRMKGKTNQPGGSAIITRREFLRISTTGIMAAFGIAIPSHRILFHLLDRFNDYWLKSNDPLDRFKYIEMLGPNQQGRVLDASVDIYDLPSLSAKRVNTYFRDWVLPITDITTGSSEDSFNMVWYKVGDEGNVHSGSIQPVLTQTNPVVSDIPPDGAVAEVTVPFTDARWDPGEDELVSYRFYYATTYWVMDIVKT